MVRKIALSHLGWGVSVIAMNLRVSAAAIVTIMLAGGLSTLPGSELTLRDFNYLLPAGMIPQYGAAKPGDHPILETVPELVARGDRGETLTMAYLGRVGLTGGQRPLDYLRKGRTQYLRDYLQTVPQIVGEDTPLERQGIVSGIGWTAAMFQVLREGRMIHYYRVMLEPHVLEISYEARMSDEVLANLRLENLLNSLEPPLER